MKFLSCVLEHTQTATNSFAIFTVGRVVQYDAVCCSANRGERRYRMVFISEVGASVC